MARLGGLDASLLSMEDDVTHLHLGSTAVFEGPVPPFADLRAMIIGKLPLVPRYRERIRRVPFDIARPVWAPDPHFNPDYHIRHTGLPSPGSPEQLLNLIGRVMANKLDLTKPLWEMWVVEGLQDHRWALISKTHYALVDGITDTALSSVLLDEHPEPSAPVPDTWRPAPEPSGVRLLTDAVADYVANPYEQLSAVRSLRHIPRGALRRVGSVARGVAAVAGRTRPAPPSSLIGPIGPHRRYGWARASLDDVAAIRRGLGDAAGPVPDVTVNDVVLAAVAGGFRDLLTARGEPPEYRVVRSLVPMSVQADGTGGYSDRITAVVVELPVGGADPVTRLAAIREQTGGIARSRQAVAAEALTSLSGFAPPLLLAVGTRVATRTASRMSAYSVHTVTTNAPGPRRPLYALGRRMIEAFPYAAIVAPARVGVAVFSYQGQLSFGVTADFDAVPDIDVFCAGLEDAIAELLAAATAEAG